MIPPIKAIRRILWGNITLNNRTVPVIQRYYPYDKTPCVTVDDSGGSSLIERHIITEEYPLSNDNPLFNPENPFEKHPQQVLREYYNTTININVWSDSGNEQEQLNNIIQNIFYEVQSDNYKYCGNYHDGDCSYMDNTCYAKHFTEDMRGSKHQCPNPLVYGYSNIFKDYNLIRSSFHVDPPFTLDDTDRDDIIYRSVFRLSTGYYIDHIIGGITNTGFDYKDKVIS